MVNKEYYQQPMKPWPGLETYEKRGHIAKCGLDLFFFEAGEKKHNTIILIHGLGDEADTWRHVINSLAEEYHIVALDLPGFGRSDKPDEKYTPQFFMNAIIGLMDHIHIEKAVLMGSSLGGILSHSLSLSTPERFSGVVLVGGALLQLRSSGNINLRLMQIPFLGEWLYTRLRKVPDAAFDSLRTVYHDLDSLPETDREFLFTRVNRRVWSDGQRRAYFSTLRNLTPWIREIQSELPERLSNLPVPTLIIRGEYDLLFSEENGKGILKVQPDVQMKTIDGVGHLPQQEAPEEFLNQVTPWLKDINKD